MELWIADTKALGVERHLEELLLLLPGPERERTLRFRKREDRLRCVVGRVMIRALAAKCLGRPDTEIRISEYGKPYFAQKEAPQFNLSHSGNLVVLAWGDSPLGVDVEECLQIQWRELASFFSEEERALIEFGQYPLKDFYRIWTVKEAFSKAVGRGLPIYEEEGAEIEYPMRKASFKGDSYCFRTWELPEYMLSVCAKQISAQPRWLTQKDWQRLEESCL